MKKCPYCAEEIQDEAIKCRFCGSMLDQPQARFVDADTQALNSELKRLIQSGKKISAIKLARQKKGFDLKAAKEYVEGLSRGVPPTASPANALAAVLAALIILGAIGWFLMMSR
jgi:ribosomal protein L7/L12